LFTNAITRVSEKVANSIGFVYGPCIRVHDRVQAVFMGVYRPSTRPSTRLYTAVYTVVYKTVPGAVYMARTRPCIRSCHLYTACEHSRVHGRLQSVYTAVSRCTRPWTRAINT